MFCIDDYMTEPMLNTRQENVDNVSSYEKIWSEAIAAMCKEKIDTPEEQTVQEFLKANVSKWMKLNTC